MLRKQLINSLTLTLAKMRPGEPLGSSSLESHRHAALVVDTTVSPGRGPNSGTLRKSAEPSIVTTAPVTGSHPRFPL